MDSISPANHIIIKGARQHNLKGIDLTIPKGKFVVFTGLSGSGKSSLAFDTIYAEGQRKYVESLSSYARQFLGIMQKPDVDQIDGLSPAISIDQKTTSHNPRSTVGTITEIYDYFRLLFARIGHPHCPQCGQEIAPQSSDQIASNILNRMVESSKTAPTRWLILSPLVRDKRGEFSGLFENLKKKGYERVRVDGRIFRLDEDLVLIKTNRHSISVVIDRLTYDPKAMKETTAFDTLKSRVRQSVEQGLELAEGFVIAAEVLDKSLTFPDKPSEFTDTLYSQTLACVNCNISFGEIEPRLFSFNTPHGACPTCDGLGVLQKIDPIRIIAPDLSLSEGAIIPLANALSSDSWYSRKIRTVVENLGGDYTKPWRTLPLNIREAILYGTGQSYRVNGTNRQGGTTGFVFEFDGIIPDLERRRTETSSEYIRQELERFMQQEVCPDCHGTRLKPEALSITITNKSIFDIVSISIQKTSNWILRLETSIKDANDHLLSDTEKAIANHIVKEIKHRLQFLISVGLDYITLHREAATLAGGEAQRIRLASQIGTGLTGVLYVLDEPTIGLHPRDNERLITTLKSLRDMGNSLVVVEHDESVMTSADELVDFGPKAGEHGGEVVAQGTPSEVMTNPASLTGKYLSGKLTINKTSLDKQAKNLDLKITQKPSDPLKGSMVLKGAKEHNLKNLTVEFPLGKMIVITGVSGSGKSTLMHETLYPALKKELGLRVVEKVDYQGLEGATDITQVKMIDQSPIGRTPRSNPATYTKAFDFIRDVFASTKEAKLKGFKPGRFSFNVKGGRCEACSGDGQVKISMQFLPDVYVKCEVCNGRRYNAETLTVHYQDKTISEILEMTVEQAIPLFKNHTQLSRKLLTLQAVGLGYVKLGQPAPTLSGGEAQRVKLAKELSSNPTGHTVYLLDEPTTGLHFEDVKNLLVVLRQLVSLNNTVIIIEHNLDVIKNADWLIDLGPEGGEAGGEIVAVGTPDEVKKSERSYTGKFLKLGQS